MRLLNNSNLKRSDFTDSKFIDSFLVKVKAPGAKFNYCDMRGCYLMGSNLSDTDFSNAKLQGADFSNANLNSALFVNAKLSDVDLSNANLDGVNFLGAWLNGTLLTRQQIGNRILQESKSYISQSLSKIDHNNAESNIPLGKYSEAVSIYRTLKNNFLSIGNYSDASWAYIKERQMRKKTHFPPKHARENYPIEYPKLSKKLILKLLFYTKHFFAWLFDWIFELTSVYGERPSLTLLWAIFFVLSFSFLFQQIGGISGFDGDPKWIDFFNYQ